MFAQLYPYVYLGAVASASAWYFLQERNAQAATVAKAVFWLCALLYAPILILSGGSLLYKAFVVPRDLAVFLVCVLTANRLASKPKAFLAAFALFGLVGYLSSGFFASTFVYNRTLDPDAELLIDVKDHRVIEKLEEKLSGYGLTFTRAFPDVERPELTDLDDYYTVDVSEENEHRLAEIRAALLESGAIDYLEENEIVSVSPREAEQTEALKKPGFGLNDPGVARLWGFEAMKMGEFYDFLKTRKVKAKKKAKIAILDTGVDGKHEDISAKFTSTRSKYDRDGNGHGTHCAGIAASVSNNGKGIASFAPDGSFVEVTSVKVLSDRGSGTQAGVMRGILEAADKGADVISMSLGGPSNDAIQRAYNKAFEYARKRGAIVVVAAGNSSDDATRYTPAGCEGVITVSAIGPDMRLARFSNRVDRVKMGIAAPGVNVFSTIPGNRYAAFNGTSMAAPYVAGLVGMMRSVNPKLTTKEAYQALHGTGLQLKDGKKSGRFIQPKPALEKLLATQKLENGALGADFKEALLESLNEGRLEATLGEPGK